jgi:hypothetical protein
MNASVTIEDGVLSIESLSVGDDVVVTYLEQLEPIARPAGVINCLQLGARALAFAGDQTGAALLADTVKTSTESTRVLLNQVSRTAQQSVEKSTETISKSVSQLLDQLGKDLEKRLDPANTASIIGKLRNALLDDYRKVTAKVREDLDLANPLSPLAALRSELDKNDERRYDALSKQVGELLQQQAARTAAAAERATSTRKGTDFESATEDFLTGECRPRKDLLRRSSTEVGLDKNNVGDFVVEINPSEAHGLRIVIEDKNAQKTTTGLVRELDKAMKNRGAAFGISVVTNPTLIRQAITPYGDDKLLVRVPVLPGQDGWDFTSLGIALEGARWKTLMAQPNAEALDIKRIRGDIEAAFAIANRFIEAKKKITAGKTYLDGVSEYLDDMRRDLVTILRRVGDAVSISEKAA